MKNVKIGTGTVMLLLAVNVSLADPRPPGVTGETWQFGPLNRWAYTHLREILPTKDISNDYRSVRPLPGIDSAADNLDLMIGGEAESLAQAMQRLYVDGILVISDGRVVAERYAGTLKPDRPHLMWSVSKTVTALTAASVAADGLIELDDKVSDYVPELADSGWGDDTLRSILDMQDSSAWTEDYAAPDSTVRRQDCADGLLTGEACAGIPVTGNYNFLPNVGHAPNRAGRFVYKSGTTDVMAWVLEKATDSRFADLVAERIWKPLGAERSAYITVDTSGFTLASGGMAATLRDIGRVGLLMLERGAVGGRQIIPAAWMEDIFEAPGDPSWFDRGDEGPVAYAWLGSLSRSDGEHFEPYYRSFTWGTGDGKGTIFASGVHGQYIFVSPATNTVVAIFSSWPDATGGEDGVGSREVYALYEAILAALARP